MLALLAVSFPYLVLALVHPAGATYTGALFSPIDVYVYLAHMLRTWDGGWLFQNPWTYQPSSRPLIYLAYTMLGKLVPAGAVPWGPALALHAVRLVFTFLFIRQAWRLYGEALPARGTRRVAMLMMLFTSGLGLLYALIPGDIRPGGAPYDLTSPQSNALFSLLQAPHNAVEMFLLLVAARVLFAIFKTDRLDWHLVAKGGLTVAAISLIHVDKMIVLGLTSVLVLAWMRLVANAARGRLVQKSLALAAVLSPGVPYSLYLALISGHDQVLQLNVAQWPPPTLGYLLINVPIGYGIPGALAVVALLRLVRRSRTAPLGLVFLSAFVVSGLALLPFSRGLPAAEASQVGLAGLAAVALLHDLLPRLWRGRLFALAARRRLFGYSRPRLRLLTINLVIIAASPTVLALIFATPRAALAQPGEFYVTADDVRTLDWMNSHVAHDDVVVGTPESAEFVVAYGGARVVYGNRFFTPNYDRAGAQLRDYFQHTLDPSRYLQARNIQWLYFGPREARVAAFDPSRSPLYEPAFSSGSTVLYRVVSPTLVAAAQRQ